MKNYVIHNNGKPMTAFGRWGVESDEKMKSIVLGISAGLRLAGKKRVHLEVFRVEPSGNVLIRTQQ